MEHAPARTTGQVPPPVDYIKTKGRLSVCLLTLFGMHIAPQINTRFVQNEAPFFVDHRVHFIKVLITVVCLYIALNTRV